MERYSYDPWGKRPDPATWVTPAPGTFSFDPAYFDRGYTDPSGFSFLKSLLQLVG